jgi:hypothetical protein
VLSSLGVCVDVVDIRDGRQVNDRVAALERTLHGLAVHDRSLDALHDIRTVPRRRPQVIDDRLMTTGAKLIDHV